MAVFPSRKYISKERANTFGAKYRALMAKHPFLLFGLPFMTVIVGASFVLTPATAVRYERYDRKVRQMTREEELGVGKSGRKVDIREEYYVRVSPRFSYSLWTLLGLSLATSTLFRTDVLASSLACIDVICVFSRLRPT
jgi:cytochrome c oxidase assembly protein subunit 16